MDVTSAPATWQEAFERQSIPNIRAYEKQLHASSIRDKEKLRALVGSNYRELLSTAEQIICLSKTTREAEFKISSLSQACHAPDFSSDEASTNLTVKHNAQLAFTDSLLRCSSKSTKDGKLALAGKCLIIVRLLLKSLGETNESSKSQEWLQDRLRKLRRTLLTRIERELTDPRTNADRLVESICAYCLVTSSSAIEAVNHFQMLRARRLTSLIEAPCTSKATAVKLLEQHCEYLVMTVATTKMLSGRRVVEMLNSMQKQPILHDTQVQQLESLQLDLVSELLPPDILNFVPYFKRTTLTASQLKELPEKWVSQAVQNLTTHIQLVIESASLMRVLHARHEILSKLLPACFSAYLNETGITAVQNVFTERIKHLLEQQTNELQTFSVVLGKPPKDSPSISFWRSSSEKGGASKSGTTSLSDLQTTYLGIDESLRKPLLRIRAWSRRIHKSREDLQSLSKIRWQDKLEEYDDDDEDTAREIVQSLARKDPDIFMQAFDNSLRTSATSLVSTLGELVSKTDSNSTQDKNTNQTGYLLRAIREVDQILRALLPTQEFPELVRSTAQLEDILAQNTSQQLFAGLQSSDWPVESFAAEDLPSPRVVLLLRELCSVMLHLGGVDLWTASAVAKVRLLVLQHALSEQHRQLYICSTFDESYLRAALGEPKSSDESKVDATARKAGLYWGRTRALFGAIDIH